MESSQGLRDALHDDATTCPILCDDGDNDSTWLSSPPSAPEVTQLLNQHAFSVAATGVDGVCGYFGAQLRVSNPCEDRLTHGKFKCPWGTDNEWMVWGVFDGHAGWETAELISRRLVPCVRQFFAELEVDSATGKPGNDAIDTAVKTAFITLDDRIMGQAEAAVRDESMPFREKVVRLTPSYSGSCALLALYDPAEEILRVACTGDSRAVLGKRDDAKTEAVPLSVDQTGKNQDEIARLKEEHPDEDEMIADGRVLGIMVSRAFGDARFKWNKELVDEAKHKYSGLQLQATTKYLTPPYLTCEPVITTTKIQPGHGTFLILASDGIWDNVSNEQAADLVGRWLSWKAAGKPPASLSADVELGQFDLATYPEGEMWQVNEKMITVQDDNPAVHLLRNSLGGSHHDMISGALAFPAPLARNVRDDMTVQVILFK